MTVAEADGQACINVTRSPGDPGTFGYRALTSRHQGAAGMVRQCAVHVLP